MTAVSSYSSSARLDWSQNPDRHEILARSNPSQRPDSAIAQALPKPDLKFTTLFPKTSMIVGVASADSMTLMGSGIAALTAGLLTGSESLKTVGQLATASGLVKAGVTTAIVDSDWAPTPLKSIVSGIGSWISEKSEQVSSALRTAGTTPSKAPALYPNFAGSPLADIDLSQHKKFSQRMRDKSPISQKEALFFGFTGALQGSAFFFDPASFFNGLKMGLVMADGKALLSQIEGMTETGKTEFEKQKDQFVSRPSEALIGQVCKTAEACVVSKAAVGLGIANLPILSSFLTNPFAYNQGMEAAKALLCLRKKAIDYVSHLTQTEQHKETILTAAQVTTVAVAAAGILYAPAAAVCSSAVSWVSAGISSLSGLVLAKD